MLDAELRDDRNRSEHLAVALDVVVVRILQYLPRLESPVDCLVARSHMGLLCLILHWVARIERALDLVRCTDVSIVGSLGSRKCRRTLLKIFMFVHVPAG
jgi:hypothetical protein